MNRNDELKLECLKLAIQLCPAAPIGEVIEAAERLFASLFTATPSGVPDSQ